ncbi:hypothetical protein Gohar_028259 [Gossypium harknessii]|uniref:DUF4283 domain-containing protein n=1 Tax=Gossypium harknessii TaxID=34285 RepID=A0A7J9IF71_9ROSI|nr:hypothetical protein [Gossypium harknessii]
MENELAHLSINEEEEDAILIPIDPSSEKGGEFFQLVECFLTASMIHFSAIKVQWQTCGIRFGEFKFEIWGEKRYLFQFFHVMDMDKVLKGSLWTFNNHLLVLCFFSIGGGSVVGPSSFDTFLGSDP